MTSALAFAVVIMMAGVIGLIDRRVLRRRRLRRQSLVEEREQRWRDLTGQRSGSDWDAKR